MYAAAAANRAHYCICTVLQVCGEWYHGPGGLQPQDGRGCHRFGLQEWIHDQNYRHVEERKLSIWLFIIPVDLFEEEEKFSREFLFFLGS